MTGFGISTRSGSSVRLKDDAEDYRRVGKGGAPIDSNYGRGAPGPGEKGSEAQQEHLEESAEQVHKTHEVAVATHRAARSWSSALGGMLTLAGAALVFVATLFPNGMVSFMPGHPLYSIGIALMWWGPVALLLVAGVLAVVLGQPLRAVAGGLAVGVPSVVLFHFVGFLFLYIDLGATSSWNMYVGLIGSVVALAGGLIALLQARVKT